MSRLEPRAGLLSDRPGPPAVRLLVGSHLLLLLQSLLILASPARLGGLRPGIMAICALALLALGCGLVGIGKPGREHAKDQRRAV
jgi:hypothetical protein